MSAFPGAGAQVYYNAEGEPLGWDYPGDPGEDPGDPYDGYDVEDDYDDVACPECDQASVVDEDGCCVHCGTPR